MTHSTNIYVSLLWTQLLKLLPLVLQLCLKIRRFVSVSICYFEIGLLKRSLRLYGNLLHGTEPQLSGVLGGEGGAGDVGHSRVLALHT